MTGADLSRVDTSADDIRKDARAAINDLVEKLRSFDLNVGEEGGEGGPKRGCMEALSSVAELCREEAAAGEANRMAVGEVCARVCVVPCRQPDATCLLERVEAQGFEIRDLYIIYFFSKIPDSVFLL